MDEVHYALLKNVSLYRTAASRIMAGGNWECQGENPGPERNPT